MRLKLYLVLCITLFMVAAFTSTAQSQTGIYEIFWNGVIETDVVAYRIYLEERSLQTGFTLQPLLDPSIIDVSSFYYTEVVAIGLNQYIYELIMDNDGQWIKVGVLAVNSIGQIGLLGSHATPFQKQSPSLPPDVPVGVGIRLKLQQ